VRVASQRYLPFHNPIPLPPQSSLVTDRHREVPSPPGGRALFRDRGIRDLAAPEVFNGELFIPAAAQV